MPLLRAAFQVWRFLLRCFCTLAALHSLARASAQDVGNFSVSVWGSDEGLPNSTVTAIAQTPEGYLWVGTFNGLARFDGVRFVTFSPQTTPALSHPRVQALKVDRHGTLWISTYDGALVSYRGAVFVREWPGDMRRQARMDFVPTRGAQVMFVNERGELLRRPVDAPAGSEWQVTPAPPAPLNSTAYCEDGDGTLWCLTRQVQIFRLTGTGFVPVADAATLGSKPVNLLTDQAGRLWVATDRDALRWNGSTFESMLPREQAAPYQLRFLHFPREPGGWAVVDGRLRKFIDGRWIDEVAAWNDRLGEPFLVTQQMHEDREGGLWFARARRGVFYRSPDGRARHLTTETGLAANFISSWFEDREGNIWLGAERRGLMRLRKTRFQTLAVQGDSAAVPALTVSEAADGAMWIGTFGGGLVRSTSAGLERFGMSSNIPEHYAYSVAIDRRGRTWVSTEAENLYLLEQGRFKRPPWYIHGVKAAMVDRRDRLWIGTKDQLCVITDDELQRFESLPGVEHPEVRAVVEAPDGGIWVGLGSGHLYRYDGREFALNPALAAQPPSPIAALLPDADGSVWVGTFGAGLLHVTAESATRYTKADGLPDDVVGQIVDDGRGCLWIGSHQGVFRVSKKALRRFKDGLAKNIPALVFGRDDGLPSQEMSTGYQPAACRTRAGILWFTTAAGAAFIDPAALSANPAPPQVLIEDIVIDGARHSVGASSNGVVEIYPGAKHVEIQYTGLCFASPEQVRFRYRLEGLETQWYEVGRRRFAQYSNLPPGRYRFQVSACNSDGVWSDTAATTVLKVTPHLWQTWWFLAAMGVAALGLVSLIVHRISTARLQRQVQVLERRRAIEQDRARIARDIHDDLGAGLTQISLFAELLRRSPRSEAELHSQRISETAQSLARAMDGIVWAVNSKNDTLESLITYLSGFASEFLRSAGLKCRLEMPAKVPPVVVTSEIRNHVLVALKETLNNVVKHAQASEVHLRAVYAERVLNITIHDDGRGFAPDGAAHRAEGRVASGNGLVNLGQRMSALGGTCRVRPGLRGRGTIVEFMVPIAGEGLAT